MTHRKSWRLIWTHRALCSRNFQNVKLRPTIQESICHSIWCEINFGMIWVLKIAIFTILETLKIEIWQIWDYRNGSNLPKLNFKTSKSAKNDTFWPFEFTKIWLHVKSELQGNCEISTKWSLNFTFWKFLEHCAQYTWNKVPIQIHGQCGEWFVSIVNPCPASILRFPKGLILHVRNLQKCKQTDEISWLKS